MADASILDWDAIAYRVFQAAREDLSLGGLETALEANDGPAAAELVNRALDRAVEAHTADFLAWHQIVFIEGAEAEARAARARGSWVHETVSEDRLTGASDVSRKRLTGGDVSPIRLTGAEDLLSRNSSNTLQGTVNGREVRAEYVQTGPDRRGAYWRVFVDGELHSHFRTEAGVQNYVAVALAQAELPKFAFNVADPRSIAWAREQSSRLVTEILPETRKAVQESVSLGISEGIPPRESARVIRSQVGFRTDQSRMVRNLGDEFDSARPGTVVERFPPRDGVRRTAGFKAKVPDREKIGESAYQEWRTRQLDRYREMQHRYRARMIARSETIRSANAGQLGMWRQGAASGVIPPTIKRKWITAIDGRERDTHRDHNGTVIGINESWEWGYEPGTEVSCRCSQGLVEVEG